MKYGLITNTFFLKEFSNSSIFLSLNTLLSFWNSSLAITTCLQISVSHFPSSVRTLPSYLNFCTCLIFSIPNLEFTYWAHPFANEHIHSVLQFIISLFFLLFYITFCRFFSFLSISVMNTVSSASLMLTTSWTISFIVSYFKGGG